MPRSRSRSDRASRESGTGSVPAASGRPDDVGDGQRLASQRDVVHPEQTGSEEIRRDTGGGRGGVALIDRQVGGGGEKALPRWTYHDRIAAAGATSQIPQT